MRIKNRVVTTKTKKMVDIKTLVDTSDNAIEEAKIKMKVAEILTKTKIKQNEAVSDGRIIKVFQLEIKMFTLRDRLKNV